MNGKEHIVNSVPRGFVTSEVDKATPGLPQDHPGPGCSANNSTVIEMAQCPRFNRCSAPICPIDEDWRDRGHRKGEPVCAYLRRYAKDPLWGQKQGSVPTEVWSRVVEVYPQVIERYTPIKKVLERASGSPFRTVVTRRERRLDKSVERRRGLDE